jgi:mannose-6-phosphate isomerase
MRPEEWIGSTTTRFGEAVNGLSKLSDGRLLKDAISADPVSWLGEKHLEKFGNSIEILVKLLDPDQRLPVHYHPNQSFAKEKLHMNHGKTEAWIILDAPVGAKVGIGFKKQMSKAEVAALVKAHDSQGLLDSLVFKEVKAGDAVFVPAGVAHEADQ